MRLFLILICWVLTQQKDNETDQPPRDTGEDLHGMSKQENEETPRDSQNGSSSTAVKDTVRGRLGKGTWAPHSERVLKMLSDAEKNRRRFRRQELIPKGLTNVALYKPAWASSYYDIYNNPNSANDGNLETSLANCFSTAESDNNDWRWWRVDLLAIYDVFYVSVTNRGDCCQDRMRNFTVRVAYSMKQKYTPIQSDAEEKTCERVGTLGLGATVRYKCQDAPILGRYVTLVMPKHREHGYGRDKPAPMHLCELQVLGRATTFYTDPAAPTPNTTTSIFQQQTFLLNAGRECIGLPDNYKCNPNSVCQLDARRNTSFCKLKLDEYCGNNVDSCSRGMVCSSGFCKLDAGQRCREEENTCSVFTTCKNSICKYKLVSNCAAYPSQCSEGHCDPVSNECKLYIGQSCGESRVCTAGAECKDHTCQCQGSVATLNGSVCAPLEGLVGGHCVGGHCQTPGATCSTENGTNLCVCEPSYIVQPSDFSCKTVPGGSIPCTNETFCTTGYRCGGYCYIPTGHSCVGQQQHTACEQNLGLRCNSDDICRLPTGADCSSDKEWCVIGTMCEYGIGGYKCRALPGGYCDHNNPCQVNSVCERRENHPICVLKNKADCYGSKINRCNGDAVCDNSFICRNKVGKPCNSTIACRQGLVCDTTHGQCRLDLGADCTDNTTYCRDRLVCDQQDRCRIEAGGTCEDQLHSCLSGGRCREGVCECNPEVAVQNGSRCEPLEKNAGGPCTGFCEDPNAICEENNDTSTCICLPGYDIDKLDFSCKLPVGEFCHGKEVSCETGTVCDVSRTCKLEVGESCQGKNRGNCKLNTVCAEGNLCRLPLGGDCSGVMKSNCDSSTVCDATGVCKKRVGSVCSTTSVVPLCVWGAKCMGSTCLCDTANTYEDHDTQICFPKKGKPGGECDPNDGSSACEDPHSECSDEKKCQCLQGYVVSENSTCVLRAGQQCSEPADNCMTGTRCEGGICKPQVGMPCSLEKDVCTEGTFCDEHLQCRLTVGSDCKTQEGDCAHGAVCDNLHTCRVKASYNCYDDSDRCVAGASCDKKDLCVCNLNVARQSGSLCLPKTGRAKGPCTPQGGTQSCITNAKCVSDGYCVCTGGYEINSRDYSCVKESKTNSGGSKLLTIAAIIGGVVLALLCVIAFVAFLWYRLKSNDTRKDSNEIEELRQQSKLSRAVDNPLEEEKRQTPVVETDKSSSGVDSVKSGASPQTSFPDNQYSSDSTASSAAKAQTLSRDPSIALSSVSESGTQPLLKESAGLATPVEEGEHV